MTQADATFGPLVRAIIADDRSAVSHLLETSPEMARPASSRAPPERRPPTISSMSSGTISMPGTPRCTSRRWLTGPGWCPSWWRSGLTWLPATGEGRDRFITPLMARQGRDDGIRLRRATQCCD